MRLVVSIIRCYRRCNHVYPGMLFGTPDTDYPGMLFGTPDIEVEEVLGGGSEIQGPICNNVSKDWKVWAEKEPLVKISAHCCLVPMYLSFKKGS